MGTRETANVSETTSLEFQFIHYGIPYDAYSVDCVTIHATAEDAYNNTGIIQTIPSYQITRVDTGLYRYTVSIISTQGLYYDRVLLTPIEGGDQIFFINFFFVAGTSPSTITGYITGTIISAQGDPIVGVKVYATPSTIPAIVRTSTGSMAIALGTEVVVTNDSGYFRLSLFKNMSYNIIIREIGLQDTIIVPNSGDADLFSLIGIQPQTSSTSSDTGWV